jgi:quercetin dioxygenase-like cupin family protein
MATEFERTGAGVLGRIARRMSVGSSVWYMGNLFDVLAGAEATGGRFALIELLSRKGTEPPRHVHAREDEAFYVLEGAVTYYVGDEVYEAGPGTFVSMPRGVPHSFVFETEEVRKLAIITPGGLEEHFRDPHFSKPARALTLPPPEGPPDMAAVVEDLAGYGVEIVGPPGPPEQG